MANQSSAGQFVWHDLMTTDRDGALKFYTALFDWNIKEMDMGESIGMYHMIHSGETGIGGAVPLEASHGLPSHWISYIGVNDVDAACKEAKKIGGQVPYEPFDIPNVGRTAVVQGASGAYFSPFADKNPDWTPPEPGPGLFTWHELMSTDIEKAKPFYTDIFGWGLDSMDMGPSGMYWLFQLDGNSIAGGVQIQPETPVPSNWLPYIGVKDVPASASKAESLGGSIFVQPTKVPDPVNVHFAVLGAPDGSMFGILEMA